MGKSVGGGSGMMDIVAVKKKPLCLLCDGFITVS